MNVNLKCIVKWEVIRNAGLEATNMFRLQFLFYFYTFILAPANT